MKRASLLAALAPVLLLSHAARADRLPVRAYVDGAAVVSQAARPWLAPPAIVAATDEQRGVPSLLLGVRGANAAPAGLSVEATARFHLAAHAERWGVAQAIVDAASLVRVHDVGRGAIIAVFRQSVDGIELYRREIKVAIDRRDGSLLAISGALHPGGSAAPKGVGFALPHEGAIARAIADLYGVPVSAADLAPAAPRGGYARFAATAALTARTGARFRDATRVKPVYYALPDRLVPAYFLEIDAEHGAPGSPPDAFAYVVAADDGRILLRTDLVHYDAYQYRVWAQADGDKRPYDGPLADFTPHPTPTEDDTYPDYASPNLVSMEGFNTNPQGTFDPWLPPGETQTVGNNVDAYTDDDHPNGFSGYPDIRATTTSANAFDRTYDVTLDPQSSDDQRMAAVTSLFYTTNWLHDWWYDSGFDEAAGNAQQDNFGRGGVDGDPLHAEAQDGAPMSHDNSNMSAFFDGKSPQMQMYVWTGPFTSSLAVDAIGPDVSEAFASFGPQNYTLTAPVALLDDGVGTTSDACDPLSQDLTGKIALIDRGTCDFQPKVFAAQGAGAVGVLIADNVANEPPFELTGDGSHGHVTIPSMMISMADGATIKAALANGVTATMSLAQGVERDGTIDNSVVAHEWGHYLHLRQVNCTQNICLGESEGWADFDALMMVIRGGDDYSAPYALAQYASVIDSQDPGWFGIRRYPYSVDMNVNPLTFTDISSGVALPTNVPISDGLVGAPNNEVHDIGEVWALMLFEGYQGLLARTLGAAPAYTYDDAHRRMGDYVEGGLTLAPDDPTFTEQRDAVLTAAHGMDDDDLVAIAQGFAKRGAGTCAVSPPRTSMSNLPLTESFKLQPNLEPAAISFKVDASECDHDGYLDAGERGVVKVTVVNAGPKPSTDGVVTVSAPTKLLLFPSGASAPVGNLAPYASVEISVPVEVDPKATELAYTDILATLHSPESCVVDQTISTEAALNVDEHPESSTSDNVEALDTTWKPSGQIGAQVWQRQEAGHGNHVWHGVDEGFRSDTSLESPTLDVSATKSFSMHFTHRHSFEFSQMTNWDGGVIEITTDGGMSWNDASMYGTVPYGGMIGQAMANNVLMGRQGFVSTNASWPKTDDGAIDFGTKLAGKSIKVRFRIGSDDAQDAYGWDLDDIAFDGITNTPFARLTVDAATCRGGGAGGGDASANGGGGEAPGDTTGGVTPGGGCQCELGSRASDDGAPLASDDAPLAFAAALALAGMLRRRRRAVTT